MFDNRVPRKTFVHGGTKRGEAEKLENEELRTSRSSTKLGK
jgi:hypothetical protein